MKRFYSEVTVAPVGDGWQVKLDGRGIRTPGRSPQEVTTRDLAELLAAEWRDQGEEIDPKSFVFRDMADYAIDVVASQRDAAISAILAYGETDTLCYRADPEDALFRRQEQLWEPLIGAFEERHAVSFARVSGIVHRPQSALTMARLRDLLEQQDHFTLASLQTLASIAASLIVALEMLEDGAEPETLFTAANCEQDWQAELWGWDAAAENDRATRLKAFTMAAEFLRAARNT